MLALPTDRFGNIENKKIDKLEKEFCLFTSKYLVFIEMNSQFLSTASGSYLILEE